MNKIKSIVLLILLLGFFNVAAQTCENDALYCQRVTRDDHPFKTMLMLTDKRGLLILTTDSLIFKTKKAKNSYLNFSIPYTQIASIKRCHAFVFPNRIKIKMKKGKSYRLFTYRRKNIIDVVRSRLTKA